MSRPFVITVASEKGGVGKTTIATNLAVYLKALREDLPVTIASFDNHFSVDQMFALGKIPEAGVATLLEGATPAELATLGQYGVQFIASSRRLTAPHHPPSWLRRQLHGANFDGLLILDTRPILDWFTEAALLAADLVLVPIKDRAALVNAAALRQVLAEAGRADLLWLVASLVDPRARLNATVRVHEFLRYAARERDYQVLDVFISKSPKVEGLASGFSSSIRPVLTHARNTAVHGQMKQLAEFALARFDHDSPGRPNQFPGAGEADMQTSSGVPHLVPACPLCGQLSEAGSGHLYFDLRSRRRGLIHPGCFTRLADDLNLDLFDNQVDLVAMTIDGPGSVGPGCRLAIHLCSAQGGLLASEELLLDKRQQLGQCLAMMTGHPPEANYRQLVLVSRDERPAGLPLKKAIGGEFARKRRLVARELRLVGLL